MTKDVVFKAPDDWRGKIITQVRKLIKLADPEVIEDVKWKTPTNPNGVLVWYHDGMLLTGEIYKKHLRLSFAKGPLLKKHDVNGLINSYRAIIITEETKLDEAGFKELIREAVKLNQKGK
ncbi:MAG: DUF1801 domain-containing protein [Candidatus Levybacteria bacterium]|nr:DUF1801 domain-containing protein [Candidatus Levybacteria bacterium]MBP9815162.1 DUF1801 domain-containing protein [Candidatus Levybacteria bacterium]